MVSEVTAAGLQQEGPAYEAAGAEEVPGASFQKELESRVGSGTQSAGSTESMDDIFQEAADRFGLSVKLLKAVAKAESNFNPNAVSSAGAQGVMQLMPATARGLGVSNAFDARQNIMGGAQYLKSNLDRYGGNVALALAAYNAGPANVEKYGGIPPFSETQHYVSSILSKLDGEECFADRYVTTGLTDTDAGTGIGSLLSQWSSLLTLNSLYGMSSAGSVGSLPESDGSSGSGSLPGISSGSTGLFGDGTSGLMSMMSMLLGMSGLASSEGGLSQDGLSNLLQIMRIRMMMDADNTMGDSII